MFSLLLMEQVVARNLGRACARYLHSLGFTSSVAMKERSI